MARPKEARKYLEQKTEVKALTLGFFIGVLASITAQILLLAIQVKTVGNMVELQYLDKYTIWSIHENWFGWVFLGSFLVLLGVFYYGYMYIHEIPPLAKETYVHGTKHKRVLTQILNNEFEKHLKPAYTPSSALTTEKDFRIWFEVGGKERLWIFVREDILQLECLVEREALYDLYDEVDRIILKTIKNAKDLAALYNELLQRPVDEDGFRDYLSALNSGTPLEQVRQMICQSHEYKEKHA